MAITRDVVQILMVQLEILISFLSFEPEIEVYRDYIPPPPPPHSFHHLLEPCQL